MIRRAILWQWKAWGDIRRESPVFFYAFWTIWTAIFVILPACWP